MKVVRIQNTGPHVVFCVALVQGLTVRVINVEDPIPGCKTPDKIEKFKDWYLS